MTCAVADIQSYYQRLLPTTELCELLSREWRGCSRLSYREFCVETTDGVYIRWQSVASAEELNKLLKEKRALKLHTGAIFSNQPRFKKRGLPMEPRQRELVFDVDVNDYTLYGIDPNDIEACDNAWPIVAFGLRVVKYLLHNHFGFRNMLLVYSGRRGAHLTVYDARACELTDEARATIVAFIQPSDVPGKSGRLNYSKLMEHPNFTSLFESHVLPMWTNFCLKPAQKGGMGVLDSPVEKEFFMDLFGDAYAKDSITPNGVSGLELWANLVDYANRSPFSKSTWSCLRETVLHYLWPRLDANVTKLRNHLNKSVYSVHPNTGRICLPVKGGSLSFKPQLCPTCSDVLSGSGSAAAVFKQSVVDFRQFITQLRSSSSESWQPPRLNEDQTGVFSMVSQKRDHSEVSNMDENKIMYTDRKRFCANTTRVFSALASQTDPTRVKIFFHTNIDKHCVDTVYAGYYPPCREDRRFPKRQFIDAIDQATKSPGHEVVCHETYVGVLFHPRNECQHLCEHRINRIEDRLMDGTELCEVNSTWGDDAVLSMLKMRVFETWNTKHVFFN